MAILLSLNAGRVLLHDFASISRAILEGLRLLLPTRCEFCGALLNLRRLLRALLLRAERRSDGRRGRNRLRGRSAIGSRLDRLTGWVYSRGIRRARATRLDGSRLQQLVTATRVGCDDSPVRSLARGRSIEEIHAPRRSIGEIHSHRSLAAIGSPGRRPKGYGAWQAKFAASSMLPVPWYLAT
jgi:hypothetical protein